jgi:hypothetical protein
MDEAKNKVEPINKLISHDDIFKVASNRMFSALIAFYNWKWLSQAINVNNQGKAIAERNVSIINKYSYFFHQVLISTYKSFVADLAIFFDSGKYDDKFSIEKLLGTLEKKISESELETLRIKIDEIKRKHGIKISFILELRNADVAHQEIKLQSRKINYSEIKELFSAVQEILNLISNHYDGSVTVWDHLEGDVASDMQYLFDNLERGENTRLKEIRENKF